MTDQTIPADEVRKIIAFYRDGARGSRGRILDALRALLPPTLADMTEEERAECQWMQADIIGGDEPLVITRIDRTDGTALILDRNGCLDGVPAEHVTPRPDLPRLQWPGDTPAPALPAGWRLADHPRYGRVFVTAPEPDGDGDLWFIDPSAAPGVMEDWCDPDVLTYIDTPAPVPPNTLAVGSVWIGADALTRACDESQRDQVIVLDADGDAFVWSRDAEWWEGSVSPLYAPYTIIHAGKKAADAVD